MSLRIALASRRPGLQVFLDLPNDEVAARLMVSSARLSLVGLDAQNLLEPCQDDLACLLAIITKARGAWQMTEFIEPARRIFLINPDKLAGVCIETSLGGVLLDSVERAAASLPARREQVRLALSTPQVSRAARKRQL